MQIYFLFLVTTKVNEKIKTYINTGQFDMIIIFLSGITEVSAYGDTGLWPVLFKPSVILFRLTEVGTLLCSTTITFPLFLLG